jgi:glycerol kinase
MLGIPVIRSSINETTALGAALLAGLATGYWLYEELPFAGSTGKIFQPKLEQTQATARYQEWSRAVKQVMVH